MGKNNMLAIVSAVVISMTFAMTAQAKGKDSVGATSTTQLIQQAKEGKDAARLELQRRMSGTSTQNAPRLTMNEILEINEINRQFLASKKPNAAAPTVAVSATLTNLGAAVDELGSTAEVSAIKATLGQIAEKAPGTTKLSESGAVEGAIYGGQPGVKGYAAEFAPQTLSVALTGVNEGFQAFVGATGSSASQYSPQVLCDAAFALAVERQRGVVAGDAASADADVLAAVQNLGVIRVGGVIVGTIEQFSQDALEKAKACKTN